MSVPKEILKYRATPVKTAGIICPKCGAGMQMKREKVGSFYAWLYVCPRCGFKVK